MKNTKKFMLVGATALACVSTFIGAVNFNSATAEGGDFYMDGASVRMVEPTGIRFHTVVENKQEGYSYGTLIIPQADFTGEALTVETPKVVDIPAVNWKSETEYTTALGGLVKDGVISNFPKSQYNSVILARSYAKDTTGAYTYTETTSRTLAQVASIALTDTREDYVVTDAEDRTYLAGICDYVLGDDGFALNQTSVELVVGTSLDLTSVFATNNGNEGLKAIWEVTDGADYVTVTTDELGALTGVQATAEGTAVLTATIGSYEVELTVNVEERKIAANEVIDFKYATDLSLANITKEGDVNSIEFVEEFQGAQGVLKVNANNWGRFGFDPLQDMSAYEGYNYLVVRMWVETTATDAFMYIGTSSASSDCRSLTNVSSGRWLNYYFKGATFKTQWADLGSYYSSIATNRAGNYYIDKIYMTNEKEVIDFTHSTDVASAVNVDSVPFSYVEEFQGMQGVLKLDAASWGCFKFKAIMGGSNGYTYDNYAGSKYLVIRMYATNACAFQIASSNGGQLNDLELNAWTELYFDAAAFMNQWKDTGNYYSALILKSAGTYYIDKIYMTDELPEKLFLLDFKGESSTSYLTSGGWDITSTQYYSEFQGAQGVLAITGSGSYALQCFKFASTPALRTHYTHFVIRAYADTTSDSSYIQLDYYGTVRQPVEKGVWKDYIFTIAELENFIANASYKGLRFGGAGTYYIDCMYVTNL